MKKIILTAVIAFSATAIYAQNNHSENELNNRRDPKNQLQYVAAEPTLANTETINVSKVETSTKVSVNGRTPNMPISEPKSTQEYKIQTTPISNAQAAGLSVPSVDNSAEKARLERHNQKGPDKK